MKKFILLLLITVSSFFLASCRTYNSYQYRIYTMETIVTITCYAENETKANTHFSEVENIYNLYHKICNDYKEYDNITNIKTLNLNRNGYVSNELYDLLKFSFELKEKSNGYFEPFIGNLSHLWKENVLQSNDPNIPCNEIISNELKLISEANIIFKDDNYVELIGEANLDLGAIAKGYATNVAKKYLDDAGVNYYLINAGNSNLTFTSKPGDKTYGIGVTNLDNTKYNAILNLKNNSISTSSYKEQNKTIDGILYTHLINPKTGYPESVYSSLSVIGEHSGLLDAYSTMLYFMPLEDIKEFVLENKLDVLIYQNDVLLYSTLGENK